MFTGKQIKAIRNYQDVCIRLNAHGSTIDHFSKRDEHGNATIVTIEDRDDNQQTLTYSLLYASSYDHEWQSFLALLRPSDTVKFIARNNSNTYVTDAGMVTEQLLAIIHRGKKQLHMVLDSHTVPADYFGLAKAA